MLPQPISTLDEGVANNVNGTHPTMDGHLKRKSIADSPGSPTITTEPKRPKTTEFSEESPAQKNTEVTQVELNSILSNIFHVVHNLDRHNILATITIPALNGENTETSLQSIQTKLKEAQYSSPSAFKNDMTTICKQAIFASAQDVDKQEYAQKLLQLASDLISDKFHYTVRSHGKKAQSQEESSEEVPERNYDSYALFQRSSEGFVFTSKGTVKDDSLMDPELAKTTLIPTTSSANPPLLKDVNTRPRPASTFADQIKKKSAGVEFFPYAPFSSFAPFVDSSNAEMNAEDTSNAYDALLSRVEKKTKSSAAAVEEQRKAKSQLESILEVAQQYKTEENKSIINEANLEFLSEEGLDVKSLLELANNAQPTSESLAPLEAIQRNATLLFELYKFQEERFASKDQTISAREKEIANILRDSLMEMASQVTPSTFVTPEVIEDAMKKIPYKEAAFTGTLPTNKPFAFPVNTTRGIIPPNATLYPTHNPVAHRKPAPPTTIIPQVVLSPHINMTGGYPSVPQPHHHHAYSIPQQPTHQKTYSRPRSNTSNSPTPLQVSANGDVTFRKNFHTVITSSGGTPAHWRRNDSQIPCANCGTLVSPIWRLGVRNEKLCNACGQYNKKWNGLHRPVSLFPNTQTPTLRKIFTMAPINKKKVKSGEGINSRLALVMKSGKYQLGYKSTLKTLRQGKSKLVIISGNCPPLRKSEIEYYAMLSKTGVHHYTGTNVELGTACGKYFRVGVLSITDAGDSDIIAKTEA
ncbi:60S ribosomal protein L30 [Entomortierella lignicola]|nr:60S ribosomal protein L30 [Entomortierella lignicola]